MSGIQTPTSVEARSANAALAGLPVLGAGLGYRAEFRADLFRARDDIGFLEVTADHFAHGTPESLAELELLRQHFPLVIHGLNLSLGSAEGLNESYLDFLGGLVERVDPPWWSEHIAFTRAGGIDVGHLAGLPFTHAAIDAVCRNVERALRRIRKPLLLENITYVVPLPGAEMDEAEFVARILDRTGCGLLLDVANLHINAANHGYDTRAFLARVPLERTVQVHFAGGFADGDVLVDSHSHATPTPVWDLLEEVLRRAPVRGVTLERDEDIPPFSELRAEVKRANELGRSAGRW